MRQLLAQAIGAAPDLPTPPALEHHLLEQPWPTTIALVGLGILVLFALNARSELRKGLLTSAGFVLTGIGVLALANIIETDRERLTRLTRSLIERTIDADVAAVRPLVASDLHVGTMDRGAYSLDHDRFLQAVGAFDLLGIRDWSASPRGSKIDGPNTGRVDFAVRVAARGGVFSGAVPSVWRFTWRKSGEGEWRMSDLACLSMYGKPADRDAIEWARRLLN